MYYHIVKKDGLKYKDLDIKEVDKIIKKEKLNFNNSRIYSSIENLEHTFKIFEDEESRNLPQTLDRNEIRISDILSCNKKKKYLKNCSNDFFLKIFNSSFKPRGKVFFNKTFIISIFAFSVASCSAVHPSIPLCSFINFGLAESNISTAFSFS